MANLSSGSTVGGSPILTLNDLSSMQTGGVVDASTTKKGIVQLADSLNIDSSSLALTAKQGKLLNDVKIEKSSISNSVTSTSSSMVASSLAVKTAYDRGTEAVNIANTKIDQLNISDAVDSDSSTTVASSLAVKMANDNANTKASLNSSNTESGGVKTRLNGTTLYMTNNGNNP